MYKIKNILTGAAFALFTGLATISGNVIASTPDGETPANEGVCDVLHGGTPGLYGLCVAYCEAQDLDMTDKRPPSLRILANYDKKKQPGDLDMPCISPDYGCFNEIELNSIMTTNDCFHQVDPTGKSITYGNQSLTNRHFITVDLRPTASCIYSDATNRIIRNQYYDDLTLAQAAYDAVAAKCP